MPKTYTPQEYRRPLHQYVLVLLGREYDKGWARKDTDRLLAHAIEIIEAVDEVVDFTEKEAKRHA